MTLVLHHQSARNEWFTDTQYDKLGWNLIRVAHGHKVWTTHLQKSRLFFWLAFRIPLRTHKPRRAFCYFVSCSSGLVRLVPFPGLLWKDHKLIPRSPSSYPFVAARADICSVNSLSPKNLSLRDALSPNPYTRNTLSFVPFVSIFIPVHELTIFFTVPNLKRLLKNPRLRYYKLKKPEVQPCHCPIISYAFIAYSTPIVRMCQSVMWKVIIRASDCTRCLLWMTQSSIFQRTQQINYGLIQTAVYC